MKMTVRQICDLVKGELSGNGDAVVERVASLSVAGPGDVTFARREHLKTALRRDFGRSSEEMSRFRTFLNLLEQKCFAYAFFQDFRNYVQHCGFPVGEMSLVTEGTTRSLELAYSKSALLAEYKKWEKSGLAQRQEMSGS